MNEIEFPYHKETGTLFELVEFGLHCVWRIHENKFSMQSCVNLPSEQNQIVLIFRYLYC